MKKTYFFSILILFFLLANFTQNFAQVGINTTTPQGILDARSSNMGIVLPRIALTSTIVESPVTNPQTGNIILGTVIYNTEATTSGVNDVSPGIYAWDGFKWIPQFPKKQSEIFKSSTGFRPASGTPINIINTTVFTADYTGRYGVKIRVDFGGGNAKEPDLAGGLSDGLLNVANITGTFTINFGGDTHTIPVTAYSTCYDSTIGATNYFAIWEEFYSNFYVDLNAEEARNISMTFLQGNGDNFQANGTLSGSDDGTGYVSLDIPCFVEVTYLGE
ncbi:MAG: hypothetical protein ACJA1Z_001592 [Patiriisocius sp.]